MKIRNGFVSNSSSSSFICDVSGRVESGMDMCIEDAGMYECENGHTIDEDYVLEYDLREMVVSSLKREIATYENKYGDVDKLAKINEITDEDELQEYVEEEMDLEERYNLPAAACPICQLEESTSDDMVKYLLKELNKTKKDAQKDIKVKFDDYEAFQKHIK